MKDKKPLQKIQNGYVASKITKIDGGSSKTKGYVAPKINKIPSSTKPVVKKK